MYHNPHTGMPQQRPQMTQQQQQQQQQWLQQQQQQQWTQQQQMQQMYQQQQQMYQQQFNPGQQQFSNQFQPQQQMVNQGVTGRFGQPNYGNQTNNNPPVDSGRFGGGGNKMQPQQEFQQPPQFQQPVMVPQQPTVMSLVVNPMKHRKASNSKLTFTTNIHSVTEKDFNIDSLDEPYIMEDSLPAIHSFLTDKIYNEEFKHKTVNVFPVICRNTFADKTLAAKMDESLNLPLEEFFKVFRNLFETVDTRYAYSVLEWLDECLTLETNEYLSISSNSEVSIDSFSSDFNDLIKALQVTNAKLKDAYIEHLTVYLETFRSGKDILNALERLSEQVDEPEDKKTRFSKVLVIAYLDRHLLETGLELVGIEPIKIEKHPSNMFLLSIVELMGENDALTFNLMTMDGCIFLVTHSEQSEVYIKRV